MQTLREYKKYGIEVGRGKYDEEMVYGVGLVYISMVNVIGVYLKDHDLSPTDMNILMIVKHHSKKQGVSQVDLGQRLMVTAHNVTRAVQRLEREGLLQRVSNKEDARVNLVTITVKGSRLLDKIWPGYEKCLQELSNTLTVEEQKVLSGLMQKWLNNRRL